MIADQLSPPKLSESILFRETKYFTIRPINSPGIFEYIIKPDTILTDLVAREAKRAIEELMPEQKVYLLVSSEGFFRVTKKARKLGAAKRFSAHLAAVACYTSNTSLALLGELYNKINKPAVPTKMFHNKEAALEWLIEKIAEKNADRNF